MGSGGYIKNKNTIYTEYNSCDDLIGDLINNNEEINNEIIINDNIDQNIRHNGRSFLEMMNFYFNYPFVIFSNACMIFLQKFKFRKSV